MIDDDGTEYPDAAEVVTVADGVMRLTFTYEGKGENVTYLDQDKALWLLSALHEKIEQPSLTPVSPSLLQQGQMIQVEGSRIRRLPGGELEITLLAIVDGRRVSIPFELSSDGVKDLKDALASEPRL